MAIDASGLWLSVVHDAPPIAESSGLWATVVHDVPPIAEPTGLWATVVHDVRSRASMPVFYKIAGTQRDDFTVGSTGLNPCKLVATATGLSFQDAAGNPVSLEASNSDRVDRHLINIPEAPGDTVEFRGWAAFSSSLIKVKVYCATANTVGTYTLTVTNNATGNTMLNAATFDLNSLSSDTVTNLTLTGVSSDLDLSENDRWTISVASNDAGMDAAGIYIDLVFRVP